MLSIKAFFKAIEIFLLISLTSCASTPKSDGYDYFITGDLHGLDVYWVACRRPINKNSPIPCRVSHESLYDKHETKFCDLALQSKHIKKLQALSKDLVALTWYASYKSDILLTNTIINFTNCHTIEAKIDRTLYLFDLILDEFRFSTTFTSGNGTFHTVFDIPEACDTALCISTFDAEGKPPRISNLKSVFGEYGNIDKLKRLDWEKETYLVSEFDGAKRTYNLSTSNGMKFLIEVPIKVKYVVSDTREIIRFCEITANGSRTFNCTAFDNNGRTVSNATVNLNHEAVDGDVQNLQNGDFLLFTDTENPQHSYVTKVTANGEQLKTLELIGLPNCPTERCQNKEDLKIFNNRYCRSVLRLNRYSMKPFNYGHTCFSDKDFE